MTKKLPSVFVCMPTYDTMHVATCLSLIKLFDKLTQAKIKAEIGTFKCPYVGYGRNVLTSLFLESGYDYQLFIDADMEFDPKLVGRMLLSEKANSYFYNFWDTVFDAKSGYWWGEDTHFCNLARNAGFKFYAVADGETTHHGNFGFTGTLLDTFKRTDEKSN